MRESLKQELLDHHFDLAKPTRCLPAERFMTNNTQEFKKKKAESRSRENSINNEYINKQNWNLSPGESRHGYEDTLSPHRTTQSPVFAQNEHQNNTISRKEVQQYH